MKSTASFKQSLTRTIGRTSLKVQQKSPEILLAVGIVSGITAAVLASKATLKAVAVVEDHKNTDKVIEEARELTKNTLVPTMEYTDDDYTKDKATLYVQTGLKLTKLYAPAVGFGVLSIACLLTSHGIMGKRQASLIAAYNVMAEGFKSYRDRVIEEHGEEVDRMYKFGIKKEEYTETVTDGEGKKTKEKRTAIKYDNTFKSVYAKFFDEASTQWRTDPQLNLYFLNAQQNYANDKLHAQGHLFLNEVYDMLGIPRTRAGAVVGWLLNKNGDNFVDFDIYNIQNEPGRDFVNGYNRAILLDFNVDGVIADLI